LFRSNGYEATQSITAKKVADDEYVALVVPQRLETKRPMIEILSKGVSYLIESSFVFKAGTQHTITVTLNSNPEKVKIEIGGEIEGDWD
ncbi:MAG: fimbrillin family protein, partial [Alistipes sp.]|nr:fimbrillin family protein [Alistipes sp.]